MFDGVYAAAGPRGLGTRASKRVPYVSPFKDWGEFKRPRGYEFPADHMARARVVCTDYDGHPIEVHHISAGGQHGPGGLRAIRKELYADLRARRPGTYVFYNDLSPTEENADGQD